MIEISLTEARARLPELLTRAAAGEDIHILRRGKPEAVLIGHARWMKTKQHDVIIEGREIGRRLEELRALPREERYARLPLDSDWDAEAHIAEIRAGRDVDPWDRVEQWEAERRAREAGDEKARSDE